MLTGRVAGRLNRQSVIVANWEAGRVQPTTEARVAVAL